MTVHSTNNRSVRRKASQEMTWRQKRVTMGPEWEASRHVIEQENRENWSRDWALEQTRSTTQGKCQTKKEYNCALNPSKSS